MQKLLLVLKIFICLSSCGQSNSQLSISKNQVNNPECDDPDAGISCSFINMPASASHIMRLPDQTGTPMTITGTVYRPDGKPYAGVVIYAYHTDEKGTYSKSGNETGAHKWHGKHHGWAITNEKGSYEIRSIRPAKYPNSSGPAHIHAAVKTPDNQMYWISDFVFKDDPSVGADYSSSNPGGTGIVNIRLVDGRWEGIRDIKLSR